MMKRIEDIMNRYGLAYATVALVRDEGGAARAARLVSCNEVFTEQTGLQADNGDDFLRDAFGVGGRAALITFAAAASSAPTYRL